MKFFKILALSAPLLLLSACVDQATADAKMEKGCRAGVQALIGDKQILDVISLDTKSKEFGNQGVHRFVTIKVNEKDGYFDSEGTYQCVFLEQWGAFKSTHSALLMQIDINGEIYGKDDQGVIQGDWEDFVKLSGTVDSAMK